MDAQFQNDLATLRPPDRPLSYISRAGLLPKASLREREALNRISDEKLVHEPEQGGLARKRSNGEPDEETLQAPGMQHIRSRVPTVSNLMSRLGFLHNFIWTHNERCLARKNPVSSQVQHRFTLSAQEQHLFALNKYGTGPGKGLVIIG